MKEVISKAPKMEPLLPCTISVNNIEGNEEKRIANEFNIFFVDNGPDLAKEIPRPVKSFERYVLKSNTTMPTGPISVNELKNAFVLNKNK